LWRESACQADFYFMSPTALTGKKKSEFYFREWELTLVYKDSSSLQAAKDAANPAE
jgi:hypothetical protein